MSRWLASGGSEDSHYVPDVCAQADRRVRRGYDSVRPRSFPCRPLGRRRERRGAGSLRRLVLRSTCLRCGRSCAARLNHGLRFLTPSSAAPPRRRPRCRRRATRCLAGRLDQSRRLTPRTGARRGAAPSAAHRRPSCCGGSALATLSTVRQAWRLVDRFLRSQNASAIVIVVPVACSQWQWFSARKALMG